MNTDGLKRPDRAIQVTGWGMAMDKLFDHTHDELTEVSIRAKAYQHWLRYVEVTFTDGGVEIGVRVDADDGSRRHVFRVHPDGKVTAQVARVPADTEMSWQVGREIRTADVSNAAPLVIEVQGVVPPQKEKDG